MRSLLACATLGAVLALAAPAGAASIRATELGVEGQLVLEFRGTPEAGCAATGLCGVSGVVTWSATEGSLITQRRRARVSAAIQFGGIANGATTRARVTRPEADGTARVCTDVGTGYAIAERVTRGTGEAEVGLRGSQGQRVSPFTTRCAGPQLDDVLAALPYRRVPLGLLRRAGATIDLRGETPFTAGGLTGRVRSTLVLRLGPSTVEREEDDLGSAPRGLRRQRLLLATYAVERVTGSLRTDVRGSEDPAQCGPIDACGLAGSLTERVPAAPGGTVRLVAPRPSGNGPLRAALGLLPGAPATPRRAVRANGYGGWPTAGGSIEADLARPGSPACRDRAPVRAGLLDVYVRNGRVRAEYQSGAGLRTRCPGPYGIGAAVEASGTLPVSALRRRRVVLRLREGSRAARGGYRLATTPDLTVVLRRTSVREVGTFGVD